MTVRACEWDGCEVEVTGRSKRCPEHQAEYRREADAARKHRTRNADKRGQAVSAFPTVSPDDADREAAAFEALKRAGLPAALIMRIEADPGAPFDHAPALAKMRREVPADWARLKVMLKKAGVSIGDLEQAMGAGDANGDGKQGRPVVWNDPEPWPEPVDGAALLDALVRLLGRYASLPDGGAVAVALWALYTWTFRAFAVAPNLMITAPERESGKTRVTELLSWVVPRAKPVSDASAAAIIRGIERDGPTLLFDEAQHFLNRRPDDPIRGILLAGFAKRFATVERCEGDGHEVRVFSTFCPKAMNGRKLVTIDDMLTSRSVVIPMMRAARSFPELRADLDPVDEDVRRQCARWRNDHLSALREADPDVGARIGRVAQVWRPLFAIADTAGGEWPAKARAAADALAALTGTFEDGETLETKLLADVRAVFEAKGNPERIKSKELDEALRALPERPWGSMPKTNKPITYQLRGRMLAGYGVQTETLRFDDGRDAKGYERAAFAEAWTAYLPEGDGDRTVEPLTCPETRDFSDSRTVDGDRGANGSGSEETPEKQGGQRFNGSETGVPGESPHLNRCTNGPRCPRNRPAPRPRARRTGGLTMASERRPHPGYTPTAGEAYRALRER